jgi:phospholipid-binding lipoprotein MlaA
MNRTSYKFNDALDRAILKPVARGYMHFPEPVRTGVNNFFVNLEYPVVIVNDLLQGQVKPFFSDIGRLLLNTTLGIGGFLDPATAAGLEKNDRDFGQTLGKWGVPKGPYLVVPFFGSYTVRDGFGTVTVDTFANPRNYLPFWPTNVSLWAARQVDRRSRLLPLDATIQSAYDPYAFIRNAYLQNRDFKVHGAESTNEAEQEQKLLEEAGEEMAPAPSPPETQPPVTPPPAPQPPPQSPQPPPQSPPPQSPPP